MKARFSKKLPLASAFTDVPEETLMENLTAFQKRTKKMRDSTPSLTMVTSLPWFEPDDMDIVKATLALILLFTQNEFKCIITSVYVVCHSPRL